MAKHEYSATCVHCGEYKPFKAFRRVVVGPPEKYLDFCNDCVEANGVEKLYESYPGRVDKTILNYLRSDEGQQAQKVHEAHVAGRQEAMREMAAREVSRRFLLPYVKRFFPTYSAGWVHQDICRRLEKFVEAVERQESPRLILTMPPRHGKSTLVSDMFPSWVLGKHPTWEIISTSYAVSLPIKFSRAIRDRLRNPLYNALFPQAELRPDAAGVEEWRLTQGGGYRAAGVGGGITGMGAHILIVDDPLKDDAEAQSDTIRENVKSWFNTAAYNRLAPGGGVLIVQTRWHDDDLAGSCITQMREQIEQGLPEEEIDMWEIINYPAIAMSDEYLMPDGSIQRDLVAEELSGARLLRRAGEALHPERYDLPKLLRIKNRYAPHEWNALYQQDPVPDDGAFFSKDMMRFYHYLPGTRDEYTYITAWDVAIGEKKRNDWTVGVTWAINEVGDCFVVDMIRGRLNTMQIVYAVVDQIDKYQVDVFGMEHGQIKITLWPLIVEEMRRRNVTCSINDDLKPITDKENRATTLRGMMQLGRVYFPHISVAPWVDRMVGEMLRFPSGVHDDIVDAMAWAARMYRAAPRPQVALMAEQKKLPSWRDELHTFPGVSEALDTSYMGY